MRNLTITLVVLVAACSSPKHDAPAHGSQKRSFSTARAMLPGYREFDLLSGPVAPGQRVATPTHITWAYSNCVMTVDPQVQPFFLDSMLRDDTAGNLTGEGTNTGKEPARFAAMVSCKVPEGSEVEGGEIKWPELIVDAGVGSK